MYIYIAGEGRRSQGPAAEHSQLGAARNLSGMGQDRRKALPSHDMRGLSGTDNNY